MSEKRQERIMVLSGLIANVRHGEPEASGENKGKVVKPSYVNLDFMGAQLNFPLDYETAVNLKEYDNAVFEFFMSPRLVNGKNAPYCVFTPKKAKFLGMV